MENIIKAMESPLFDGIRPDERTAVLSCLSYHIRSFVKGETIAFENDAIRHIGIPLTGAVDMIKEDFWGNKTLLIRTLPGQLFGETFACGEDTLSVVRFVAYEDTKVLYIPFERVMHSCSNACSFHHQLISNMVRIIAGRNRDLLRKIDIISKRSIREKLLSYLSQEAQQQQSRYFQIPLGRLELAEYLCVDRSAMTRELARMKEDGLIDFDRNCFRML